MKPESDFTTPRRLIVPISRHFFPVEQPDPCSCTTGLKNGSRLPVIAHFFSSFGLGAAAGFAVTAGIATATGEALAATTVLACCLESALVTGFAAGVFDAATAATGFAPVTFPSATFAAVADFALAAEVLPATCA